jgi:arylformamidase
VASDLPADLVKSALAISGLYELEPLRHAPFLAPDIRLDAASALRLSPAALPPPRGWLATVVGGDESEEFQRQAALISQAWGPRVIAAERVARRNHMDVLNELADPRSSTHRQALQLLGLPSAPQGPLFASP